MTSQSRPKIRARNSEETKARLIEATIDLLAEKGIDALSLAEVARRAGLSRGIAYHHFRDRDHLLIEAKSWTSVRLQKGMETPQGVTLHDRIMYSTKFVIDNPEPSKLMIVEALSGGDLSRSHPLYKLVQKRLRQLIKSGAAREDLDVEILTYITFSTIATVLMLRSQHLREDMDKLAERYTDEWIKILISGIFAKDADLGDLLGIDGRHKPASSKAKTKATKRRVS